MNFVHPTLALVGLAAIALPIIIHLLIRRRVKPVRWAAMRFLLDAYKQSRRRLLLEQILVLLARCALVGCVALALGRLLFGGSAGAGLGSGTRPTSLILLIDDSLTSGAGDALARHKSEAARLLSELNPGAGDTAALVTLSRPAEGVVLPPSSDIGAVRSIIERLTPTDASADLAGALHEINRSVLAIDERDRPRVVVAVLSDFLAGSVDLQTPLAALVPKPDALLFSAPRADGIDNVAITSVEPLRSVVTGGRSLASSNQVRVTLMRSGPSVGEATSRVVRVLTTREGGGSETLAQAQARFEPGQREASVIMQANIGPPETGSRASRVIAATIDADALPGDDGVHRVIEFRDSIRVAVVAPRRFQQPTEGSGLDRFDAADWISLALEPIAQQVTGPRADIETSRVEPGAITSARLAGFDAIALCAPQSLDQTGWRAISSFVDQGGLLMIVPPAGVSVHLWADQLASFDLGWTVGREGKDFEPPQSIDASTTLSPRDDLLSLVRPELQELVRAVGVRRALPLAIDPDRRERAVLGLADGSAFLVAGTPSGDTPRSGRGLVVLFAASLDLGWTDLPAKPLIVPLVQEIVRQGVGVARGIWHASAGTLPPLPAGTSELRSSEKVIETGSSSPITIAIAGRESAPPPIRRSGVFRALDAQGSTRAWISIAPDPRASDTSPVAPAALRSWLSAIAPGSPAAELAVAERAETGRGQLAEAIGTADRAKDRSFALLLAALALALAELVLARWSSHARVSSDPMIASGTRAGTGGLAA
ncbi:MAG: BatA domain-containing protein [Phycisphaeraceae bacterium]|nr:BatA domain-containing protein [Phycisphaeraceae bacterium]